LFYFLTIIQKHSFMKIFMQTIASKTAFVLALLMAAALVSCNKDDHDHDDMINPNEKGSLRFEFDNVVGEDNLQLGTSRYKNAAGEEFTVSLFNYYLSNFVLVDENGKEYVVPQDESYFLVKESDRSSQFITIPNVPAGNYKEVRLVIGVDSLRNTMDLSRRTGVLDPANNTGADKMYWSWNSGYIFVKLEGNSPQAPADPNGENRFRYHIGGFGGFDSPTINNIKTVTLPFKGETAKVRKDKSPLLHFTVDVLKVFGGKNTISVATHPTVMFNPFSVNIADNYESMIEFHHQHKH
jgi:hypothetical protein